MLKALVSDSYQPLERSSLKVLSFKTALLLVLASAKRVSELCTLSVHPSCLLLRGDHSSATLRPNPSFVPKNIRSSFRLRTIQIEAFCPPPHGDTREAKLHLLFPVHVLAFYVERMAPFRHTEQLFMCYGEGVAGKALSKKRLASWLCECISQAYRQAGKDPLPWSERISHMV